MSQMFIELQPQAQMSFDLDQWFRGNGVLAPEMTQVVIPEGRVPTSVHNYVRHSGLELDNAKYSLVAPNYRCLTHKDGGNRIAALNIPVWIPQNQELGLMHWFADDLPSMNRMHGPRLFLQMAHPTGGDVHTVEDTRRAVDESLEYTKDMVPTHTLALRWPTVVRINEWHNVDNRGNQDFRLVYTLRFKDNPSVTDIATAFGSK